MHAQVVQFAGTCVTYNDATEWNVTRAFLGSSAEVTCNTIRQRHTRVVDSVMHAHGLLHIGWLKPAPVQRGASSLDLHTQQVPRPQPALVVAQLNLTLCIPESPTVTKSELATGRVMIPL